MHGIAFHIPDISSLSSLQSASWEHELVLVVNANRCPFRVTGISLTDRVHESKLEEFQNSWPELGGQMCFRGNQSLITKIARKWENARNQKSFAFRRSHGCKSVQVRSYGEAAKKWSKAEQLPTESTELNWTLDFGLQRHFIFLLSRWTLDYNT